MQPPSNILFQLFVKPFYKENSGVFIFIFAMMFFIVSQQSGAGLYEYHYSLCIGMLSNNIFLIVIFSVWLIYSHKCVVFVSLLFNKPEYSFSSIYNSLGKSKRVGLFFIVQVWLMLPILLYALFILHCGLKQHLYTSLFFVFSFLFSLCFLPAIYYVHLLKCQQRKSEISAVSLTNIFPTYQPILLQFVASKQKLLWIGLKLFTCGLIYMISRNDSISEPRDIGMLFVFYDFGILANGIIVFRIRQFEEFRLFFYRGLPVSYFKRFINYSILYFILLIPEFITLTMLVPKHLEFSIATRFALCGYSLLLFMNSISFVRNYPMKDYLKILLLIFCIQYALLNTLGLDFMYLLCFFLAMLIFKNSYYKFERTDHY